MLLSAEVNASPAGGKGDRAPPAYNIEFTFDCDVRCAITIMYACTEDATPNGLVLVLFIFLHFGSCSFSCQNY